MKNKRIRKILEKYHVKQEKGFNKTNMKGQKKETSEKMRRKKYEEIREGKECGKSQHKQTNIHTY
jgi:hypothetical protein